MYEIIKAKCETKGIHITNLCKEITGSSGNIPTWKKGNIKAEYLKKIAQRLDVSADYLLGLSETPQSIDINAAFGERLKIIRTFYRKTQKEIAFMLKISMRNYQSFEYGEIKPSFDTLIALADYFNVSLDYLVGRTTHIRK